MKLTVRDIPDYCTEAGLRLIQVYHVDVRGSTWDNEKYRKMVRQMEKRHTTEIIGIKP